MSVLSLLPNLSRYAAPANGITNTKPFSCFVFLHSLCILLYLLLQLQIPVIEHSTLR